MNSTEMTQPTTSADAVSPKRGPRFPRHLKLAIASILTLVIGAAMVPAAANAATGYSATGIVGTVRDNGSVACYNTSTGYYMTVRGPSVWGVALTNGERTQYVRWSALIYDATKGVNVAGIGWSSYSATSTSQGVTFANQLVRTPGRGDTYYAKIFVDWYSPSYAQHIGIASWYESSYFIVDAARLTTHC